MNKEIEFGVRHPDRLGVDKSQLAEIVEDVDFERLIQGEKLEVHEAYTDFMNGTVDSEDPSTFVLISDHTFLFDGKPFRVVGSDMTAYMNVLLHHRHSKVSRALLQSLGYFADGMSRQAQDGKLTKLRSTTEVSSGDSQSKRLTGQKSGHGTKLHRIRDDCVVFDERETFALSENATELQRFEETAVEITYIPAKPKTQKKLGNTAVGEPEASAPDDFPFPKVPVVNLGKQLRDFLLKITDNFPELGSAASLQEERLIRDIAREVFDSEAKPEDFQLRLGLFNRRLIELRNLS